MKNFTPYFKIFTKLHQLLNYCSPLLIYYQNKIYDIIKK